MAGREMPAGEERDLLFKNDCTAVHAPAAKLFALRADCTILFHNLRYIFK
jgi:hypothetical protein